MQVWPDGAVYEGMWLNDQASGYGVFIHTNKSKYEGNMLMGMANGFGTFT